MPNGWRTINSLVHKIRLHGRRGKGMAESFSRQKSRHAPQKEGGLKILCDLPPVWPRLVRPTNLMSRMDGKKTHTHTVFQIIIDLVLIHKVNKKVKAFSFCFFGWFLPHTSYIGKDLLEIIFLFFSLTVRWRWSLHYFRCKRSKLVVITPKTAKKHWLNRFLISRTYSNVIYTK